MGGRKENVVICMENDAIREAVRQYNRLFDQGESDPLTKDEAKQHLAEEIVDVLNYLLAIANRTDIDVETAFRNKNAKNQQRTWS